MYRGSPSPIFDVPEFPTLRRIRPLPKRRQATGITDHDALSAHSMSAAAAAFFQQHQQHPLDILGPNATAEDLLAHADTLSALQSYYMPILGNVQNFLAGASANNGSEGLNVNDNDNATSGNTNATAAAAAAATLAAVAGAGRNGQLPLPLSDLDSIEFGVHLAAAAAAAAAAGVAMGGLGGLNMGLVGMGTGMGVGNNGGMAGHSTGLGGRERDEDDGRGDGDYDHSRQHGHGNTKKRKVPANAGSSPRGLGEDSGRSGSALSGYLDDEGNEVGGEGERFGPQNEELLRDRDRDRERDRERDRDRDRDYGPPPPSVYPPPPFPGQLAMLAQKRGKLTAVTLAGLQHKEMLKTRKRQLAAVMGALSHGDTLALDQALSTNYPLAGGLGGEVGIPGSRGGPSDLPPVRKSRRQTVRLARAMKVMLEMPERRNRHPDAIPFPTTDFAFACPSGTADRLISTKEEVVMLRKRFEIELARQAAKAAKMAVTSGPGGGKSLVKASGGRGKRERQERDRERAEKAQQRVKAITSGGGVGSGGGRRGGDQTPDSVDSGAGSVGINPTASGGGKAKNGKKKKRSALANASNPHHLRNYVPSRLPHNGAGDGQGTGSNANPNASNTAWPVPLLFLSSEIPPRRRSRAKKAPAASTVPLIQLTHPAEEWICAFCEYDLFYGEDAAYRRAVRNRKKILRRRRRARERAAAAASGVAAGMSAAKAPPPTPPSEEYNRYDDGLGPGVDEYGSAPPQRAERWKAGPDKESAVFG